MTVTSPEADARGGPATLTSLLKQLVSQIGTLFRQEIALARAEMSETAGNVQSAAILLVVGALLGLAALIILLFAAVYGLATALPLWASALIVAVVVGVIAVALALAGKNRLSATGLMPNRTARTLRDDVELAKDKFQ